LTCLGFNALISKSLIYFSIELTLMLSFSKKKIKNKIFEQGYQKCKKEKEKWGTKMIIGLFGHQVCL
jgi:hypothetical protein